VGFSLPSYSNIGVQKKFISFQKWVNTHLSRKPASVFHHGIFYISKHINSTTGGFQMFKDILTSEEHILVKELKMKAIDVTNKNERESIHGEISAIFEQAKTRFLSSLNN
jgi:hypothetical protein